MEVGQTKTNSRRFLNNDNDEARQFTESCYKLKKTVLNPIINWEDEDVWEFIHEYNVPYCKLYDEGYKRLGCIGCPMNVVTTAADLQRYTKYREAYLRAFGHMIAERKKRGLPCEWSTPQEVMDWWLGKKDKHDDPIADQIAMELEDYFDV